MVFVASLMVDGGGRGGGDGSGGSGNYGLSDGWMVALVVVILVVVEVIGW